MSGFLKNAKAFFITAWRAAQQFVGDRCMKLSAALAYYTLFSMGPLLVVLVSITGIWVERSTIEQHLFSYIRNTAGSKTAEQIQTILAGSQLPGDGNFIGLTIGVVMLVVGATTVFAEIQDSINFIWSLKAKPKRSWLEWLRNRLLSFSLIISVGFLLLVSLVINTLLDLVGNYLEKMFSEGVYIVIYILNLIIILGVVALLFAVIFKVLPDGTIRWKDTWPGAVFTAVLFLIGKYLISLYVRYAEVGESFGTAAAIALIMVWTYYTSVILYYGAEFTKQWSKDEGAGITPNKSAVFIVKTEVKEMPHVQDQQEAEAINEAERNKAREDEAKNNICDDA